VRGEVCLGWGGLWGEVSKGEVGGEMNAGKVDGKGEGRGTYTPIGALPLNDIKIYPKQLWPKRIFGVFFFQK
jgi:hypothetical protein